MIGVVFKRLHFEARIGTSEVKIDKDARSRGSSQQEADTRQFDQHGSLAVLRLRIQDDFFFLRSGEFERA